MRLNDAEELFREIVEKCPDLQHKNFLIILPEASPLNISQGYEVTIRVAPKEVDRKTMAMLYEIANKRRLQVMEASESIIIYESTERARKIRESLKPLTG